MPAFVELNPPALLRTLWPVAAHFSVSSTLNAGTAVSPSRFPPTPHRRNEPPPPVPFPTFIPRTGGPSSSPLYTPYPVYTRCRREERTHLPHAPPLAAPVDRTTPPPAAAFFVLTCPKQRSHPVRRRQRTHPSRPPAMAADEARCRRLTSLLANLSSPVPGRQDLVASAVIWGTLAGASVLLGLLLSVLRALHRRRRDPSFDRALFSFKSALWHAAGVALVGLYPAVLAHTGVVGRVSRAAGRFRPLCDPKEKFNAQCKSACTQLLRSKSRPVDKFNDAAFFLLSVMLPAIFTGVCFCFLWSMLCIACLRLGRRARGRGDVESASEGAPGAGSDPSRPEYAARDDAGARTWRRASAYVMTVVAPEEGASACEGDVCSICLANIWSRTAVVLSCEHRFHKACIKKWLRRAPVPCCPLCKTPVEEVEAVD